MKVSFHYKDYLVEVFNDTAFTQKNDSPTEYDKVYELEEDKDFQSRSQHAITVYNGEAKCQLRYYWDLREQL